MKNKKYVKGIIYDNPDLANETVNTVVTMLSDITDCIDDGTFQEAYENLPAVDENGDRSITPSEVVTILNTMSIAVPYNCPKNFIIPSDMVDGKLYDELEKLDISRDIVNSYINYRDKKVLNEKTPVVEINKIDNETGEVIGTIDIDNFEDAIGFVSFELQQGEMSKDQAMNLLTKASDILDGK